MKAIIARLAATALAVVGLVASAEAADRVVNVYNWSDYIDDSILADFTKETGIKVVYDVYDSNETLEAKLLAGGTGYDVVVPTATFLQRQIAAGVYQKLDKSKIPNLSNMWSEITDRAQKYDPGNDYAVDYMWGTTGIGYNIDKMKAILGTDERPNWDVLLKPEMAAKFKDCGIYMLDSPSDVLPSVLAYLGLNPDSRDPAELKKAQDVLTAVRPYIRKFDSSNYISALAQGDICLVLGYSGDIFQARSRAEEAKNNVKIGYSIPSQGAQMWFDMMAIPKDAPHVAEAHEFINYIMKPEVIAKASNFVFYANGNKASQAFVDKAILSDPVIYPPDDMMKKLFTTTPYDNKIQKTVTRLWTTVVTGQ
ncbi:MULTISPECIES: polyamine ABC transporter substrate-binding protein [unclassified Rhizobium]|uniref:polyamine ABC transporter substrate-binding protein n=1 Tax=unclassified Rhizobium TaxID=2613769 RepID=UPI001ADC0A3E|nr:MULTISPECIES: polyamine ABC transporter substrate-binding protein [unclassified Rhizobium]MBO9097325.1 polyamine ABC transporter substrate-binding protein [Rhizobium sp. L58/93]MBO9133823.1 polyamine ABC transporter substrate-binding protein [Rhizobium sp. B209b/85]MBO9167564.1 polyamine ABC transporter substrate-binding protein [Rhizobium sp. L245/93]MBO9183523.1 polyamine ABC transporter substrate-binding protein [Rhizobium sp. E27B/91]QXZ83853.1 polyamine ABC transporter substrate-bindin